jgi:hypothetical protein
VLPEFLNAFCKTAIELLLLLVLLLQADLGAGVFMNENMGSIVNISSCRFVENRGHFGGGAMAIYDSDATVTNCTMESNWVS